MAGKIGKKWSDLEETELLQRLKNGIEFEEIAQLHQRTLGGIKARINKLAHIYLKEGMEMEKVVEILRMDKGDVEYLVKKQNKDNQNNSLLDNNSIKTVIVNKQNYNEEVVVEEGSFEVLHTQSLEDKIDELNKKVEKLGEAVDKILKHYSLL